MAAAKVSQGLKIEVLGVADAKPAEPLRVQLQVEAVVVVDLATQVEGTGKEGMDPQLVAPLH